MVPGTATESVWATNGSQLWDTSFSIQAILSTKISEEFGPILKKAHNFIKQAQILEDSPGNLSLWYRHISKGGWPFSTSDIGYPVTDCTAEGLKVALLLSKISPEIVGEKLDEKRLFDAVNVILSFMNKNGSFGSYGLQKSYSWLELFNPSETFENIIVDHPCVECTSASIQALATFKKLYPDHRKIEIEKCIAKAITYIENKQRPDGSWYAINIYYVFMIYISSIGMVSHHLGSKALSKTISRTHLLRPWFKRVFSLEMNPHMLSKRVCETPTQLIAQSVGHLIPGSMRGACWNTPTLPQKYGTWGICFTYGTWFGVCGLVATGKKYDNSLCLRKACNFLLSKQEALGGWGESYLSYQNKVYTNLEEGRCHPVNTAWAMLALLKAGQAEVNPNPLHRAAKVLINMQMESGEFPQQEIMGGGLGNIGMGYSAYRNIFPIWALGEYHTRLRLASHSVY